MNKRFLNTVVLAFLGYWSYVIWNGMENGDFKALRIVSLVLMLSGILLLMLSKFRSHLRELKKKF
ncbi:hypothetical protein DFR58_10357 [Anaerobacterium chartisolvens]|uniref:Uncharacterized protein n=1 Tax=Anaerobacterium chartisolvens TaxID=1297424 RepID=A0A369BCN4_9FIRM|nr:hypothetical protein [Anaerobacterium chartisolvens]RCX19312.1 hypothetical protein DFR58_10357 [Anaerobacterium chartisolvens]